MNGEEKANNNSTKILAIGWHIFCLSCVNVVRPKAKEHIKPRSSTTTTTTTTFLFKLELDNEEDENNEKKSYKKPETIS